MKPFGPVWQALFFGALAWSAWRPHDYPTWALEVFPAVLAWPILFLTRRTFPLTPLLYWLILAHCLVLIVGGHYTYAEVPLGDSISDWFGWQRNNYDKLGHFMQGLVPALVTRELFVRLGVVSGVHWRFWITVLAVLGISASYELIEWAVALMSSEAADSFLGTQGYVWDTQSDMFFALLGALAGLLALGRYHDRQLEKVR